MMRVQKKTVKKSSAKQKTAINRAEVKHFQDHISVILLLVVMVIAFITYLPALQNQFTNWDDNVYIADNPYITSLAKSNLMYLFSNPVASNYHPVTIISLALNYSVSGYHPFSYYLVNIILHLLNLALVYWFVLILAGKNKMMALFTAALFAVHPMHVESVAWIAERKDVLYAFFFLSGMILYIYYVNKRSVVLYLVCFFMFFLSTLSKPSAVVFPLIIFLMDYFLRRKLDIFSFLEKLPFLAVSVWIGLQTINSQAGMVTADLMNYSLTQKFLFASYGFCFYIEKLFLPFGLSAFYPFPVADNTQSLPIIYWISPLLAALLVTGAIYSLKYTRTVFFGIFFYFLSVALTLQFIQVGNAVAADRYTYLGYIGLFIALYWLLDRFVPKFKIWNIKFLNIIIVLLFGMNAVVAANRVQVWKNSESLWSDVLSGDPGIAIAYMSRGLYYAGKKENDKALKDYTEAININPRYFTAYFNRGNLYLMNGRYQEAISDYSMAALLNPDYSVTYRNRADAWFRSGKMDSALLDYSKAIQINPALPESYAGRGDVYMRLGQYDKSADDLLKALSLSNDNPEYLFKLGSMYGKSGKLDLAVAYLSRATILQPDFFQAYLNRGLAYATLGNTDAALADFARVISIKPDYSEAYFNRALIFLNNKRKEDACTDLKKAVALGNQSALTIFNEVCK